MKERTEILEETFRKLTEEKKYASLRDLMQTLYPADIATILSDMPEKLMPAIFRLLPKDLAAETFVEMESDVKEELITSFSDTELKAVIDEMYMDDAVDLIEEMPANMVRRILAQADADTRKQINEILKYNEDSAGSVMTTEFVGLTPDMTAADAIDDAAASSFRTSSSFTGTTISAAMDGVPARTSAAKSQRVKSVSWPTAEMTGIFYAATARTRVSSLKQ